MKLLNRTGHPVFRAMVETKKALPLSFSARRDIVPTAPEGERRPIRHGLFNLFQSRRYLESFLVDGAMTYDLDGRPVAPVNELEREWAEKRLAGHPSRRRKAEYVAPAP